MPDDTHGKPALAEMIKCMFMIYRKPGISVQEFSTYWSDVHSRLAVETAPVMGMVRYVQNHHRPHPIADAFQEGRGCKMGDFDGVAEAWWENFDSMAAAAGSMPEEIAVAILADEGRFVDMNRSIIWFAEEKLFWPVGEDISTQP